MIEMVSRIIAKKLNGESGEVTKPVQSEGTVQENNNVLDSRSEDEAILSNPMLKVEVVFAKRIRNLEKRKQKLLQYGEQQRNGKPLERDQVEAYSRLDEVSKQLDFLYEMRSVVEENAKCYQRALEKTCENAIKERAEAERKKLSTLIRCRELSNVLGNSSIRKAFLDGSVGAQLNQQELDLMDTLHAVLNPSLESVCDVGEWTEKTDKYVHVMSAILNASEEVVIMQHSGNDVRKLLEKVSKFNLSVILKLLEESRRKESVRDERNLQNAMNQAEAHKAVPLTAGNDVDECKITVTSSVNGSSRPQMRNNPVTAKHCRDAEMPAAMKEAIVLAEHCSDAERTQETPRSACAAPTEHEFKQEFGGAHSLPHLEHGSHKRYGRRHTFSGNEGHLGRFHGHQPAHEVGHHGGCNICSVDGSAQGSMITEPYYYVAYPSHYFNTHQLQCCCVGKATVNGRSEVLTEGGDCTPSGYVSSDPRIPLEKGTESKQ
uniref:Caprin-1 dimerization domain-containing protein n=1 Tax=Parascaris univalens TaxID=6257 RepID=A0A915AHE1_PARUN